MFDQMSEENVRPTREFYNCVLAVCVKHGQATDAFRIYNQMRAAGVAPDIVTFTTLMYNCAEHQLLAQAHTVRREMGAAWDADKGTWSGGVAPTSRFYAATARALVQCRQAGAARQLLEEMRGRGVVPELETYVVVICGLAGQRRPHAAFEVLTRMVQPPGALRPSPRVIRAVLHGCVTGCANLPEGEARWCELVESAWRTLEIAQNVLLVVPPEALHPVLHLLVRGLSLSAVAVPAARAREGGAAAGRAGMDKALARVVRVLELMRAAHVQVSQETLGELLLVSVTENLALALPPPPPPPPSSARAARDGTPGGRFEELMLSAGNVDDALAVLTRMRAEGVQPSHQTLAAVMQVCTQVCRCACARMGACGSGDAWRWVLSCGGVVV